MTESSPADYRIEFIRASTWHGTLDRAEALLAAHPELARADVHVAVILGDDEGGRVSRAIPRTRLSRRRLSSRGRG